MDNPAYIFGYIMERATTMLGYCMLAAIFEKTLEAERKKVRAAVGHEPTQENWQYYCELRQEEKNRQNVRQQEADRENLRRLVFGKDDNNPKAS